MSLFFRIFLSFLLVASLLAASFFLLGRVSSDKTIEHAKTRLNAQAELVAKIWVAGGRTHTMHWLFQQTNKNRPLLLNQDGVSPFSMENMGMKPSEIGLMKHDLNMQTTDILLKYPLTSGMQHLQSGQLVLIKSLPKIKPPLFLVQKVEPVQTDRLPTFWWLIIAFVIISSISFLLARTLTKRIHTLRRATQKLATGDLSSRVTLSGKDEVNALANDFNQMAEHLQSMLKSQRQLVSDVSHELRSPLARLRVALELAEKSEKPKSALNRIEKEADELESLITDLLSLARIESSQSVLEKKEFSLCKLLQQIIDDANFEGESQQKMVALQECDHTIINADPILMRSAFENIIRNALRYTPANSTVTASLKQGNNTLNITITDEGKGVPDDVLESLFEPFVRISEARDRKTGGFGLGLAITGRVIEAHGGEVSAKNRPEGGLVILVTLPIITN